ncbi:hypothetical protein [Saccharothrix sp. HUAS TT1]|uniref:phage tail protein n=1 Tax=unclassified Saccharothrix TaxID=2593673 RepID=UPI00345B551F
MTSPGAKANVGKVSVKVVPDTSKFRKELQAQLTKSVKGIKVKVPVQLDTKGVRAQLAALKKQINATKGTAKVDVDLDKTKKNLSEVAEAATSAGNSFGGMAGRTALLASAITVLAAPAVALLSTLLAGLPALLFVAGAAFAAVALGMDGIKQAASVLGPSVERMKASLSATFQDRLTPLFRQLIPVMSVLEVGLNKVAVGLSNMFAGFVDVVSSAAGMKQLETILAGVGTFFTNIKPFMADFTAAILGLAEAGAKSLGFLSRLMNNTAAEFRETVSRLTSTGVFETAMNGLSQVLESALSLTIKLFEAGVGAMGQLTGPLVRLIDGLSASLVALMPILTSISSLVGNVLGQALKTIAPILTALQPAFAMLASFIGILLVEAIQALEPLLVLLAQFLGTVVVGALEALWPFINPFLEFLRQFAAILTESLLMALQQLQPLFDLLLQFVTGLLVAIEPLLPALLELVQSAFTAWLSILTELVPIAIEFAENALPGILNAVSELMPYVLDLVGAVAELVPVIAAVYRWCAEFLLPIFREAAKVVAEVWPHIETIIKGVLDFIIGHVKLFTALLKGDSQGAVDAVKQIFRGGFDVLKGIVQLGIEAVVQFFINLPLEVIRAIGNLAGQLFGAGQGAMNGLIDGIKSMVGKVKDAALNIVSQVRDLFPFSPAKEGPFSGRGYTLYSGRALISDWAKGIEQSTPSAVRAIEDAIGATNLAADNTWNGVIDDNDFGSLGDRIAEAMAGWSIEFDANGVARMVNKSNLRKARRG